MAAFGLILTRSNSAISEERSIPDGATRTRIHSTREEIMINTWGRYYVDREIRKGDEARSQAMLSLIETRQNRCFETMSAMATLYEMIETPTYEEPSAPRLAAQHEKERFELAKKMHDAGGCAMTFTRARAASGVGLVSYDSDSPDGRRDYAE